MTFLILVPALAGALALVLVLVDLRAASIYEGGRRGKG